MKKSIFIIKRVDGYFEIIFNKRPTNKRTRNLGKCILYIAEIIDNLKLQNYEVYGYERGRQIQIKNFDAELIMDFAKDKKDSIISFGEYDDDDRDFDDDDDNDDDDFRENRRGLERNRFNNREDRRESFSRNSGYSYTPKDNSHTLEIIKDNLKALLES